VPSNAERAWALFPAGSPGEYNLPRELTLVLARGEGATVWDTDGRAFSDFTMGWGSVILGHAHPAIVEAVRRRAALGSNFAYVTEASLELAEELARAVPCAERLRFCASGTEATAYALRLARSRAMGRSRRSSSRATRSSTIAARLTPTGRAPGRSCWASSAAASS
jgi:glutamate-1-semialdehyde 2,1-aminomutase